MASPGKATEERVASAASERERVRLEDEENGVPSLQLEAWFAARLRKSDLYCGVTTVDERAARTRARIIELDCEYAVAGKSKGHSTETWWELWSRVFKRPWPSSRGK